MRRAALAAVLLVLALAAEAQVLPLPEGAERTAEVIREADTVHLPRGVPEAGTVPRVRLDGTITSRAWRLPAQGQGTLARLTPLRTALEEAGWEVLLSCAAEGCGGFEFRFAVPVLPAPAMFVDLFDYRYLLARRGAGTQAEHAMLFVSRTGADIYVQLTRVAPAGSAAPEDGGGDPGAQAPPATFAEVLERAGHAVLSDLEFASGDDVLGPGPHPTLAALAAFLRDTQGARIALVGHTDNVGSLDANIALSRNRAEAVRARLIEAHGVDAARIEARGIGYLAPVSANDTAEGRDTNRRVEAVLLD